MIINTDTENKDLELYIGNKEAPLLHYDEPGPGLFIAESRTVINIALDQGYEPLHAICVKDFCEDETLHRLGDIPIYMLDASAASKKFGYALTDGVSAAMHRKVAVDIKELLKDAKRVVVLEDVENPTNLGAIMRSAAAFGIDAVLFTQGATNPLYRRALRVSMGTALLVPWGYFEKDEDYISTLKSLGFATVAMALREDNITIDAPVIKTSEKVALLMGNEGVGLKAETIAAADYVAKIPMMNNVDSLNVAVAAGIAMWEITK